MWVAFVFAQCIWICVQAVDPPVMTVHNKAVTVAENTLVAVTARQYTAVCTEALGNPVTYSIERTDGNDPSTVLNLNPTSGEVELLAGNNLDYEKVEAYHIWIGCTAPATGLKSTAHTAFTLVVSDVNEKPVNTGAATATTTIAEGTDIGTDIITGFAFSDPDGDKLQYSVSGTGADIVGVRDSNFPNVVVKVSPDYELNAAAPCKPVTFKAAETSGTYTSEATLQVCITDLNDNPPVFSASTYTSTVDLGFAAVTGTTLATAAATDADGSSPNNQITYSMDSTDSGGDYFAVSSSGVVTLAYPVDLEGGGSISARILATDGGTPANTATATFVWGTITTTTSFSTSEGPSGYCFFCKSDNLIAFICLMVICGIIAALLIYGIYRYCTTGNFLPDFLRPDPDDNIETRENTRKRGGRNSTSPLNDDDDYLRSISRQSVATPSKINPNYYNKGY